MAQFLTRKGIAHYLEEIIRDASEDLVIISPYLQIDDSIRELLEDKQIEINVLCRELNPKEKKWLDSMQHIQLSFRKNLHAKCYLNEYEALLTSMNLYEFSQRNNDEMGILVSYDEDRDLYVEIWNESIRLLNWSEEEKAAAKKTRRGTRQATATPKCPKHNKPWRKGKEYGLYHDGGCTSSKLLSGVAQEQKRNLRQLNKWLKEEFGATSSNLTPEQVAQVYATLTR